ncbi:MAG: Gfo/Idh/MocA family oxidoreductase, partial [Dehalococcoidia bacterium]
MKKQELGVAVVGSGRIGTLRANMASRHPSVRFLAVSDIDAERAGLLAESVGADVASSDNYAVISNPEVNTVIVSTPEHEHVEPVLQALKLGKPVFLEKPLALTIEDADKIVEAVEESGVELRVGYSR